MLMLCLLTSCLKIDHQSALPATYIPVAGPIPNNPQIEALVDQRRVKER
jgi:hypothetical protein